MYSSTPEIHKAFTTMYAGKIRLNTLNDVVEVQHNDSWNNINESGTKSKILSNLNKAGCLNIPKKRLDAVLTYSERYAYKFDPLESYLRQLDWDRVPRVNTALHTYTGCDDTEHTREVSRIFFLSMSAKALHPGCKVDTIAIFEREKGTEETDMLSIIGKNWYTDSLKKIGSKRNYDVLKTMWLAKIPNLTDTLEKGGKVIHHYLTRQTDSYLPAYKREAVTVQKRYMYVGETDDNTYQQYIEGSRRFMPIQIKTVNVEALRADIDQIHAEACYRVLNNELWYTE